MSGFLRHRFAQEAEDGRRKPEETAENARIIVKKKLNV